MSAIEKIIAREILDSRGNPTVEADVFLSDLSFGRASVPSGASTGRFEALELRDNNKKRYKGQGVLKAVSNINSIIAPALAGQNALDQENIDQAMLNLDGTENKNNLGANAILAVSMAVTKAAASSVQLPLFAYINMLLGAETNPTLPVPLMNIVNGGRHADTQLDFQEFMIVPVGAPTFANALRWGREIFHTLKDILKIKKMGTAVGDEGGFAPNLADPIDALSLIINAITSAGYKPGRDVFIALDIAASEFFKDGFYSLRGINQQFSPDHFSEYVSKLTKQFPIISIEDPFDQEDWSAWQDFSKINKSKIQIVGDDLFVTNVKRLQKGIDMKVANSILIKLNQIGSVSETLAAIRLAKQNNYHTIISHRSGETDDTFIADLAVGTASGQIKSGSLSRMERVAKYNQLARIEEQLGSSAQYAGLNAFTL